MFRGGEFGAGDESKPVAMLIATLRWTSWAPNVFYSQLLLSAFISVSHCASSDAMLWRAFIIGRVRIMHSDDPVHSDLYLHSCLTF